MTRVKILLPLCLIAIAAAAGCYGLRRSQTAVVVAGGDVLAVVNGRRITEDEVDERLGSKIYGLQNKLYQLRKKALDEIIREQLLAQAAQERGVTAEELRRQLTPATAEVTPEQVAAIYAKQPQVYGSLDEDEAKRRIKLALENRARLGGVETFIAGLKKGNNVEIWLRPPAVLNLNVGSEGPSKGSARAPLVLVEFSDFECPACKKASKMVHQLLEEYGDKVRLVYRHLPLSMHKHAFAAAQAAVCADRQGKFWEMHDLLFSDGELTDDALKGYATRLGLDLRAFDECVASESSRAAVAEDQRVAREAGLNSTPTFILNGRLVEGVRSLEEFKALIDRETQAGGAE